MSSISLKNKRIRISNEQGFTLIEVMIALFILVMIGMTTSKAVIDAANLKEVLKDETEFASEFRTSTGFIERDLNQVFNPRWFLGADLKPLDPYNQQQPAPITSGTPVPGQRPPSISIDEITRRTKGMAFQTYDFWGPLLDASGIRASRFKGTDSSMSFVSSSHLRIYSQKRESIYSKIKYELIKQPTNPNLTKEQNEKFASLYALVKIENPRAFDLEDPKDANYVETYIVLNNIKKLSFRYFKRDEKEPVKEWDSEGQEEGQKRAFPLAVEMTVNLIGPKDRTMDATVMFYLETPNDILPKTY